MADEGFSVDRLLAREVTRRNLLKGAAVVGAAAGLGPLLAACGGSEQTSSSPSASAASSPKRGGTIRAGITGGSNSNTLDVTKEVTNSDAARTVMCYEALIEIKPDGTMAPLLAEEMTPNAESAAPLDVTGTFTLEQTNPSCTASTRTTTQTTTGDLRGTATYAGGYLVEGRATIASAHSEGSCAAPEAPMTAPWSAAGDESTLQGAIEIPGRNGVPGGTIIFTVKAKP
jgi:hypothetical protein